MQSLLVPLQNFKGYNIYILLMVCSSISLWLTEEQWAFSYTQFLSHAQPLFVKHLKKYQISDIEGWNTRKILKYQEQ